MFILIGLEVLFQTENKVLSQYGAKKYKASLESVKAPSLEIPYGDDNKGKVKHFVFHLLFFF